MQAIIMTGGKGMRMKPYTKVLPKGLLPVGEQPILEIIVKQLHHYGFRSITMACGYLAPLIQTYFGDGSSLGVSVKYYVEQEPLGTVGPLRNLPPMTEPFLLINCDVLTSMNFRAFWDFHEAGNSLMTIASQKKNIPIELGVLETNGTQVTHFLEKPNRSACVSMGIYVMDPEIVNFIPEHTFFDIPDLIHRLLNADKEVRHYENDAFWLDIGRHVDYEQANEQYSLIKDQLFQVSQNEA